jgi:hypothetical protein
MESRVQNPALGDDQHDLGEVEQNDSRDRLVLLPDIEVCKDDEKWL